MARRVTETMDPEDFLLFATNGQTVFRNSVNTPGYPTGAVDFGSWLDTAQANFPAVVILSDFPGEVSGGIFFDHQVDSLTTHTLIEFKSDALRIAYLRVNAGNAKLELLVNNVVVTIGTVNIQLKHKYHVQFRYKVSNVSGVFEVKLDEDLDVLTFNGDTTAGSATWINRFDFPGSEHYFDSLYINDTTGGENNGYDGVVRMKSFVPTADGFWADWLLSSGVDGFEMLNETPHDSDTTIISSNVDGDKSSFVCPGHGLSVPSEIMAVSARWVVRKVSDGRVRPFFRINNVDYPISDPSVPVGVGYTCVTDRRTTNPETTLPWELGDTIDSFGLESVL